jgi:hypothetical protein
MIGAAAVAVLAVALAGTTAKAKDDDIILVGVTAERGPAVVEKLVIKYNNAPYVRPPGPGVPPDEPPQKQLAAASSLQKPMTPGVSGDGINLGGGIGLIAQATPQQRLEKSLKDLALDLR